MYYISELHMGDVPGDGFELIDSTDMFGPYKSLSKARKEFVKKIDFALRRIKTGEYGYCMETGEPIGIERLIIRPTAEFCADIKYINDDQEKHFAE